MRIAWFGASAVLLVTALGASAEAQEGLATLHEWVKVGRKTCMSDHYHDGSGTGRTRAQAERAAIQAWTDFTAWEYGPAWGRYSNAASRSTKCDKSQGGYTCHVQARPCRGR